MQEQPTTALTAEQRRQRRERRQAATRRRRRLALAGLLTLGLAAAASGAVVGARPATRRTRAATPAQALAAAATAGPVQPVVFTVEASGDLLIHSPVWERALELGGGTHYNFAALFTQIKPYITGADLPLCHVETPMTPAPPTGYPIFNTPPALAPAIRATGWRACDTAATHTLDQGQTGIDDTVRALDAAGIPNTGSFTSAAAQRTPLILTVKGVKVAFLAYTELTNGIPSPHPWSVNRAYAPQILADAHRARLAGARVVIVNIHWGDENVTQPSTFQVHLADALTRSRDITAVVGQHVHVVQPIQTINGKLVVFGEGNLISNQTSACCPDGSQDGMIALLTIVVDRAGARVTTIRYVPIWVRHPDLEVLPVGRAMRTDPADEAALRASYERTVSAVGRTLNVEPIPLHLP